MKEIGNTLPNYLTRIHKMNKKNINIHYIMPAININSVTIDRFYKYSTYQESIIQGTLVLGLIIIGIVVILCVFGSISFDDAKINAVFLTSTLAFVGLSILNYISDRKANMLEPFIIYAIEAKKEKNNSGHNNQFNIVGNIKPEVIRKISVKPSDLKRSDVVDFDTSTISPEDDITDAITEKNITLKTLNTLTEDSGRTSISGPPNDIELTPVEPFNNNDIV